jgi:hypothetical protein
MGMTATDIVDLVAGTQRELGRLKFQQIAQNLSDYEVFPKWFKKDRVQFDSGIGIQRTLMNRLSGAARHVGWNETDVVSVADLVDQLNIPWRHAQTNWAFNRREALMNRGEALVFKVIKPRRNAAMIDLVEELETKGWSCPSSTNTTEPYGIPYYVVKNATTGFNGGLPSGHSTVAGVSLTRSPTYKNYTAAYTEVSKGDLVKKLRTAHRKCMFKSPIPGSDYTTALGRYRCYVNETTMSDIEDIGESQNENLGRDIAPMGGDSSQLVFRGHPLIWARQLDSDTTDPFYGIDHATFYPVVLKGDYLTESEPIMQYNQHNWFKVFVDLTYNYLCLDRRRNWVISK